MLNWFKSFLWALLAALPVCLCWGCFLEYLNNWKIGNVSLPGTLLSAAYLLTPFAISGLAVAGFFTWIDGSQKLSRGPHPLFILLWVWTLGFGGPPFAAFVRFAAAIYL